MIVSFTMDWVAASRWSVRLVAWVYRKRSPPDCRHRRQPPRRPPLVAAVDAAASALSARPDSSVPCWSMTPAIQTHVWCIKQANCVPPIIRWTLRVWSIHREFWYHFAAKGRTNIFYLLTNTKKFRWPIIISDNQVKLRFTRKKM